MPTESGKTLLGIAVAIAISAVVLRFAALNIHSLLEHRSIRSQLERLDAYFASAEQIRTSTNQIVALGFSSANALTPLEPKTALPPLTLPDNIHLSSIRFGETPYGPDSLCFYPGGAATAGSLTLESSTGQSCSLTQSVLGVRRIRCE